MFGEMIVTPELRNLMESSLRSHIEELASRFDISRLERIVITDNFIDDVLEFQRQQHYAKPSVTDNQLGRACGKTLLDKECGLQVVFLDGALGTVLVDKELFERIEAGMPDSSTAMELRNDRKLADNIISHELAHVEFEALARKPRPTVSTYASKVALTGWRLINEYYACRRAATVDSVGAYDRTDFILTAESHAMDLRRAYNLRNITLENFISAFWECTKLSLIYTVSGIGDALGTGRAIPPHKGSRIAKLINGLETTLGKCYREITSGQLDYVPQEISKAIVDYHHSFEVFVTDIPEGERWEIPVRI